MPTFFKSFFAYRIKLKQNKYNQYIIFKDMNITFNQ